MIDLMLLVHLMRSLKMLLVMALILLSFATLWPQSSMAQPGSTARKTYSAPPEMIIDPSKDYMATMETTAGTMTLELFPEEAPKTVNNFVFLAREGFYENVIFHRVIPGFVIQGGDPTGTGRGGPGYRFEDEPVQRPYTRGTLAMANAGPNTNGSQFFIMHKDFQLPPSYTIFGQLTEGDEVLDAIATAPTDPGDRPKEPVQIVKVSITESEG
jgi:cyclophilin family peptidyl-prolyl cis-trans isomerase